MGLLAEGETTEYLRKKQYYDTAHHQRTQRACTCLLVNGFNLHSSSYLLTLDAQNTHWRKMLRDWLCGERRRVQALTCHVCPAERNGNGVPTA